MLRSAFVSLLLFPLTAVAAPFGPPLETPPAPEVPLGPVDFEAPPIDLPVGAPPVDLSLPSPPAAPELPDLPGGVGLEGPASPPSFALPDAIPDLTGVVDLPGGASAVFDHAPPFGGSPSGPGFVAAVPEPGTAALLGLGMTALAATRRHRDRMPRD